MRCKTSSKFHGGAQAAIAAALLLPGAAAAIAQATATNIASYTWATPATIAAPSGNVLETQNVGNTTASHQESLSPVVSGGYEYSGQSDWMSLPIGTYNWTFDFEFINTPSTLFGFMRGEDSGSSNSLFNGMSISGLAANQWYRASTTVTVTGGTWNGDTEIGYVEYSSTPAITSEVLFDGFSFTNSSSAASVYEANPISFAGDSAGQSPPSTQLTNSSFSTLEVIPTPEPATLGLLGAGGLVLLLVGRKRKTV